jgi:hypothetical protein
MSADTLRFDYLIECSALMESYSRSLAEAAYRGNEQHAREYFKCLQRVGKDLDRTLKEIEAQAKADRKEAA